MRVVWLLGAVAREVAGLVGVVAGGAAGEGGFFAVGVLGGGVFCELGLLAMVMVGGFVFLVVGEGDIGGGFEEVFPELRGLEGCGMWKGVGRDLGAFPDGVGFFGVAVDDWEDGGRDYSVRARKVVVDF